MSCPERQGELQQYASGELPVAHEAEVEAHLRRCASCRRDLETYRILVDALPLMPDPAIPSDLHRQLMAALVPYRGALGAARESRLVVHLRRALGAVLGVAFAAALAVALWGWWGRIIAFAGRGFSQDLVSFWDAAKDLWYLLQLLADVARILEPALAGLWASLRQTHAPLVQHAPLVFAAYGAVLLLGGWLCWHAIRQGDERRLNHAS